MKIKSDLYRNHTWRRQDMDRNSFKQAILICAILFAMAVFIAPVSAGTLYPTITIDNTSTTPTIAQALLNVANGGTIILQPGIYFEHTLTLNGSVTVKANTSAGNGAEDTIIDAQSLERIFNADIHSLTLEDLTLRNGNTISGNGAGINSSSAVTVTSCRFINCSASNGGGAIFSKSGNILASSSSFTDCSAGSSDLVGGGAISSNFSNIFVISSSFTDCSGSYGGGAIFSTSGNASATSSSFTDCSAINGGGGAICTNNIVSSYFSSFINCSAEEGGAISAWDVSVESSAFTDCSADYGGSIFFGDVGSPSSNSNFLSSSFSNCSVGSGGQGGAIYCICDSAEMHFSRIINCNAGTAVVNVGGSFDATDNWWGTNGDPSGFTSGTVDTGSWLVLGATTSPAAINTGETSVIRVNMTYNSMGVDTSGSGHVPDGIPVAFSVLNSSGSLSVSGGNITSGASETVFNPSALGMVTVYATVDNQSVSTYITVSSPTVAPTSSSRGSSSGGGPNTDTGTGFATSLKAGSIASFDMDKGAVYMVSVTAGEEGVQKIMITVQMDSSLPSSIDTPDTDVYEYEDANLYYTDNSDLSGGTFYFKVEKSWFLSNGYTLGDIVMLHYNEETSKWEELSTTFTGEDRTYYYYSAETPSFSWFAIAESDGATIIPKGTKTNVATEIQTPAGSTSTPTDSTKSLEDSSQESSSLSSLILPVLAIALILLITTAVVVRRRKNKYPDWWNKELK